MADALSRWHSLLVVMEARVLGFQLIRELYQEDEDFKHYLHEQEGHKQSPYLSKRASYSKATSYVFQRVQSKSFLLRRFMEEVYPTILGSTKLLTCSKNIFIGQEWVVMFMK